MKVVLMHAPSKTWNQSFAFGKFRDWTKGMYDSAFNDDGLLNGSDKPAYSTFKNAIATAKKTLDNIVKHKHSDGNADDGENLPAHLTTLIELWNQIKKEAEDTRCDNLTQSQRNRVVADSVTGVTAPLCIDTNATARASTTAENKRGGRKIAERNKTLPGAFSGSSGDADSPDDANKKQKRAKKNDIKSIVEVHAASKNGMFDVISSFAAKNKELSHHEFEHIKKKDDLMLKHDERKLNIEEKKLTHQAQNCSPSTVMLFPYPSPNNPILTAGKTISKKLCLECLVVWCTILYLKHDNDYEGCKDNVKFFFLLRRLMSVQKSMISSPLKASNPHWSMLVLLDGFLKPTMRLSSLLLSLCLIESSSLLSLWLFIINLQIV